MEVVGEVEAPETEDESAEEGRVAFQLPASEQPVGARQQDRVAAQQFEIQGDVERKQRIGGPVERMQQRCGALRVKSRPRPGRCGARCWMDRWDFAIFFWSSASR